MKIRKSLSFLLIAALGPAMLAHSGVLTGKWLAEYTDSYLCSKSAIVTISPDTIAGSDSLIISNLTGTARCEVKAVYDAESHLLTIPAGQSYDHYQNGNYYQVCPLMSETWSDYDLTQAVTFTVTEDSALILNQAGIAKVLPGDDPVNMTPVRHFNLYRANTQIITPVARSASDLTSDSTSVVDVRVLQTGDRSLRIIGVDNGFCYLDLDYDDDGNFTIRHENVMYFMSMYPETYPAKAHLDYEANTYTIGNIDDPADLATGKLTANHITIDPWSFVRRYKVGSISRQYIANGWKLGSDIDVPFNISLPVRAPHEPDLTLSGGSGTAEDPYQISNLADLKELAAACNLTPAIQYSETDSLLVGHYSGKYFVLTNDIDMTDDAAFTPIAGAGSYTSWNFAGNLNGNGHSISNLKVEQTTNYAGLFGNMAGGAVISNLIIDSSCSITGGQQVGGLVGYVRDATISNVTSGAKVTATKGIVGSIAGGVVNTLFDGCNATSDATITSQANAAAGIAGYVTGYGSVLKNCASAAKVSANGSNSAGGMVGIMQANRSTAEVNQNMILDCRVLTGSAIYAKGGVAGGILGAANAGNNDEQRNTVRIERCVAESGVTVTGENMQCGGIVGLLRNAQLIDCESSASVVSTMAVGGIAGNAQYADIRKCTVNSDANIETLASYGAGGVLGSTASYVIVDSCYSAATVKSATNAAGGIVGNIGLAYVDVTNCQSTGHVEAATRAGGLVGKMSQGSVVSNSFSTAEVVATASDEAIAGGLVGYAMTECNVGDSFFAGTVKSNGLYCGGIAGKIEGYLNTTTGVASRGCNIYNSYNVGDVSGAGYVGGIIGSLINGCQMVNTYNLGSVSLVDYTGTDAKPEDAQAGNSIGFADATVTLMDNYHLMSMPSQAADSLSAAVPCAELASAEFVENLGEDFIHQEASFPMLSVFSELPLARYYAAFFVPEQEDGLEFDEVGLNEFETNAATLQLADYDEVEWSATGALSIVDGVAKATGTGEATLTATLKNTAMKAMAAAPANGLSKTYKINVMTYTGINEVDAASDASMQGKRYNLNGQQVGDDAKGILIINGRKVLVK